MLQLSVNDTTVQAVDYFTRSSNRMLRYLKVEIQFRDAAAPLRNWTEKVMLDGYKQFVLISRSERRPIRII